MMPSALTLTLLTTLVAAQLHLQDPSAPDSPYEGKYKGTSFYADSDCASPAYLPLDRATLARQHRSLVCDARGHLHHTDPLHLSFTVPAPTAVAAGHSTGHKHEAVHAHIAARKEAQMEQCKRACLTTPTCMAFSFNAWDSVCNLYSVPLAAQGFVDWRDREADIADADGQEHAVWSDVVFWDADCFVRVCSAFEGEEDVGPPPPSVGVVSSGIAESGVPVREMEKLEDEEWKLGERVARRRRG